MATIKMIKSTKCFVSVLVLCLAMFHVVDGFVSTTTKTPTPISKSAVSMDIVAGQFRSMVIRSPTSSITMPNSLQRRSMYDFVLRQSTFSYNNNKLRDNDDAIWQSNGGRLISSALHRLGQTSEVTRWRAVFLTFLSSVIVNRQVIDLKLAELWTYLMTSSALPARIFRHDSYEWGLAVIVFTACIHMFGYADKLVRRDPIHPWRKYRLQDRFEADKVRRVMLKNNNNINNSMPTASTAIDASNLATVPPPVHSPWHWNAWIFESLVYIVPLLTWDILAPRRHRRLAPFGAPTSMTLLTHIPMALMLYDFFFFLGHLLMHKVPLLYKYVHKRHHKIQEPRACEAVRLSIPEEVYDVGCSIVALNLMGAHPVARSIYNCVIVFLLAELHCGFDFPWTPQNLLPFGLATGSRRHHYHHRFGKHYYQKFFFTFDRIFGFFQKNDGTVLGDAVLADPPVLASWQ